MVDQNKHKDLWSNLTKARQTKETLLQLSCRLTMSVLQLTKPQLRLVTQVLTRHRLRRVYVEEETTAHVLLSCSGLANYRISHHGTQKCIREIAGNTKGLLRFVMDLG